MSVGQQSDRALSRSHRSDVRLQAAVKSPCTAWPSPLRGSTSAVYFLLRTDRAQNSLSRTCFTDQSSANKIILSPRNATQTASQLRSPGQEAICLRS